MARTALIVGAGIGGLAAALALRRAGWDVRIFEQTDAPRELGFGLGLAPNAIAALRALGIADVVVPKGVTPTAAEIRHVDGRVLRRLAGTRADLRGRDSMTLIMRPVLHGALLDALGQGTVLCGKQAVGLHDANDRVTLQFADSTSASGDVLIGADGVGSAIRARLHPSEPPPRPSGYFALRGASPAVEVLHGLQGIMYFGPGIEAALVQASANSIYWYVSLFATDVRSGPLDAASVLRRFTAGLDRQFRTITGATPSDAMRLDELFERDPLDRWGAGRVTLLGDAAHPMLPHTGQGAAQALEDAVALGRAVAGATDPVAALRRYEDVRSRRTRRVVLMGPRIARITTTRNPVITFLRNSAIRVIPDVALVKAFTSAGAQATLGRRVLHDHDTPRR